MAKPVWREVARHLMQEADFAVSLDGVELDAVPGGARCHPLWTPVLAPAQTGLSRDIDVSMIGSLTSFPHRPAVLSHLRNYGIEVVTGGGQETSYEFSTTDYFASLRRSKIVINFSRAGYRNFDDGGNAVDHLKGRVMEALSCQALLLESRNAVTARYLEDGADYISFTDQDDLASKIKFFLANEESRALVAEQGHLTVTARYSARKFWEKVLDGVRVSIRSR
jgi:hypothetical protein